MKTAPVVFGIADGLTSILGMTTTMLVSGQPHSAVWAASLGGSVAAFAGMANGQYQSAPEDGAATALACGGATAVCGVLPAVPYAVSSSWLAVLCSVTIAVLLAAVIAVGRPDRSGWKAWARTYGLLAAAALLCGVTGLVLAA